MDQISKDEWDIFYSNYRLSRDGLLQIFPHKANFEEMKYLLENLQEEDVLNTKFGEILWRFPISMTDAQMTRLLQYFLLKDYHHEHENIISALQDDYNEDIESVNFLVERMKNLPEYYKVDKDLKYPFMRKIIYAIGAQPEPNNLETLEIIAQSDDDEIKKLALHQIKKRKNLKSDRR